MDSPATGAAKYTVTRGCPMSIYSARFVVSSPCLFTDCEQAFHPIIHYAWALYHGLLCCVIWMVVLGLTSFLQKLQYYNSDATPLACFLRPVLESLTNKKVQ